MIEINCSCERGKHVAPLDSYEISSGAINKLPEILKEYSNIYLVVDKNTYKVAGEKVYSLLSTAGKKVNFCIIDNDIVLPNAETIGKIFMKIIPLDSKPDIFNYPKLPDYILAVGSGTINDCCRFISYRLGIPYGICGTAPSMDGYVSAGSPLLHDGTKSTVQGATPKHFIADLDIMKEAPYQMMLAGIGDMFGKYTGLIDWELSKMFTGEYICEKIFNDVLLATNKVLENGYKIGERSADCVKNIVEGFLVTGLGMAFIGNSRPASGSEHIIAHAWELADVEKRHSPNLHGLEVCEATRIVAIMYKMLIEETDDLALKSLIKKYIPYFDAVEEFCSKMNMPNTVTDRQAIMDGIKRALVMRDRYTILFYLRDNGLFESYVERATDKFLELIN